MLQQHAQQQSLRLDYMDAMRGFAMTLVVIGHVFSDSFGITANGFIASFLCGTLQLPLFFMISGYFAADLRSQKDYALMWRRVAAKIPTLLVSSFLFMSVFCLLGRASVIDNLLTTSKAGYWYTFSLFEFIVIYTIIRCIADVIRMRIDIVLVIVAAVGIMLYPLIDNWLYTNHIEIYCALSLYDLKFFFSFLIGILIRMHKDRVKQWLAAGWLPTMLIISLLSVEILRRNMPALQSCGLCIYLSNWIVVVSALTLTLGLFQRAHSLSGANLVGRYFKLAGRHTLEIYFLHYYFVKNGLGQIGEWFLSHPSPLIEFVCALPLALCAVMASLVVGRVLRLCPWVSRYMLGIKCYPYDKSTVS